MSTYTVTGHATADGTPVTATATFTVVAAQQTPLRRIGMSSPSGEWDARLAEVGPAGVTSRRIFCDLTAAGNDQASLINQAVASGLTPIVSYKLPNNDTTGALAGNYDSLVTAVANYLSGLGVPVYATIWHEPYPDITGAQFTALHRRLIPLLKRTRVLVGPILNSWVLDNTSNWSNFDDFIDPTLLTTVYDWFGFDSYQSGSATAPGNKSLTTRLSTITARLTAKGDDGTIPLVVGEFNAYENTTLASICNTILGSDRIAIASLFNSNVGSKGIVLTGSMISTYQGLKSNAKFVQ